MALRHTDIYTIFNSSLLPPQTTTMYPAGKGREDTSSEGAFDKDSTSTSKAVAALMFFHP